MLPSIVAEELHEGVTQFLRSAFPIATPFFQKVSDSPADPQALIDELLARPGALFKGPYLDIKLPFRLADDGEPPFRNLTLPFRPYRHQARAFARLAGDAPQSTIVATGTGSGKTECFMLPVIDDCLTRREQGIKTIVIYPMNALASDQARRFAHEVAKLDTQLTVGLFVGGAQADAHTTMGPDHVITSQQTLRDHPPDILLTNYKMLDFLLIRPKDQALWRFNKPGMLRYLVVDELHTFDGAQGTDLACLIRRLKDRLDAGPDLACVGTSATMGTGAKSELIDYARQVFAAEFDDNAVIEEDRLSPDEYLLGRSESERQQRREAVRFFGWPERHENRLDPSQYERAEDYLFHQARLWFDALPASELPQLNAADARRRAEASVRLGELLHEHSAFHELVRATGQLTDLKELAPDWQSKLGLPSEQHAMWLIASLVSLIAAARLWQNKESRDPDEWCRPFLEVRQQLWLRELRRLVCSVPAGEDRPTIQFADDLKDPQKPLHLPLLHCRECHMAAWGAVAKNGDSHLNPDLQSFYQAWFQRSPSAWLLVPLTDGEATDGLVRNFCTNCFRLQPSSPGSECTECQKEALRRVWVPDMHRRRERGDKTWLECHHDCPECGARESLAVMGYRAATLTSVMTGRLFATPYNDDFKLIAFSDSVQDAAHRAGFMGANTWRQVVRQAMSGWLRSQPPALSLRDMADLLPAFWRSRAGNDARFCGLFIATNMVWLEDYRALTETGQLPDRSDLPDLVGKRLAWECIAEFGRRGSLGRSLERTGTAAVSLDRDHMLTTIRMLADRLREEIGGLRDVGDDVFVHFITGWLHHLRQIGAIYDPVLDGYLQNRGREYLINRLPWMPGFGRTRRPPAGITLEHVANNFEALVLSARDTWSLRWLKKTLGSEDVFAASEARQIFAASLDHLSREGWLIEKDAGGRSIYLLDPARLLVSRQCAYAECGGCRHVVTFAEDSKDLYLGMPCLRPQCRGTLRLASGSPRRTADYGATEPRRLVPSEHTGLLPRDTREAVEESFIYGHEPWDINLLSATPTLEMGIDIGALSSVFLCSVPPAQANYLQRIGRAGRRDGNALAVTVANGQNHDLFFYSDPKEMMVGAVHTPGVFLHALAVLERQLIAYCFDRWAASGIDESAIPGKMRQVIDAVESQDQTRFPYNLIQFASNHKNALLSGFYALFESLGEDAKTYLNGFLSDTGEGSLSWRVVSRLQQLVEQRKSLRQKVNQLKKERERLERLPDDEATRERIDGVERERGALLSLLTNLNGQLVANFFTDEGLLPNYAFPEEGVTLQSVILRRRSSERRSEGDSPYEKAPYAFQRPAQAALGELAPQSRFYAISHEMEIDQVDLRLSESESWRFCDRCQHTERVDASDAHSACPRCGSPQWADSGQKHTVLKLRQVYSTVDDRTNRIGDDSEQREPQFFNRQMLVDVPPDGNHGGYRLKSDVLPFGFEFLRRVTLREVNFGPAGGDTNSFAVAGRELPRRGFRICRHCGKVQKERPRRNEQQHAYTCPLRRDGAPESEADYFDSLYLYRELNSEAIRILLPLSEVAYSDEKLHSFIAALNLGLRRYFKGDVHHLEVTDMREPPSEGSGERVYLVVYDRIPGGTGYLKDLMRARDNLMKVLEAAYDRLTSCECIDDENRDGCYRCILAYRDSRNMATISRKGAAELLGEILALRDQLEAVETLGNINTNVLIESKLEQKFVDALGRLPGAQMTKAMVNGKTGSLLTLPGEDGRPTPWRVEHQVKVGPGDGVAINTEIDVLLTPGRAEDAKRYRPIAVYLDGLQYHHEITADDVAKRSALLLSGRYWVYSLNWDDIPEPGKPAKPNGMDLICLDGLSQPEMKGMFDRLASPVGWSSAATHAAKDSRGGMDWIAALLRNPGNAETEFRQRACFRGFTTLAPRIVKAAPVREAIVSEIEELAPEQVRTTIGLDDPDRVPGGFLHALGNLPEGIAMAVSLPMEAIRDASADAIASSLVIHLCFDDRNTELTDEFKTRWRGFWHAVNQLQFLNGFSMATRRGVNDGTMDSLWAAYQTFSASQSAEELSDDSPWAEVYKWSMLDPEQIDALVELALPEPEVGIDLETEQDGVVLGGEEVELCWRAQKVAVTNSESPPEKSNWWLIPADEHMVDRIKELIDKGVF